MKMKSLIPLVAILVVLGGFAVLKSMKEQTLTLEEAAQLTRLTPDTVTPDGLVRLELFAGTKPEERVVLARDPQDTTQWVVVSSFDAPADQEKAKAFATLMLELKGELREAGASEEHLADYKLTDEAAFHIDGFTSIEGEPAFTVLVGNELQGTQMFARQGGMKDVYVINKNPRQDAGVMEIGSAPTSDHWIQKTILELAKDSIEGVSVANPDKTFAFERREVAQPEPEAPAEGEATEAPQAPQYEWVLAAGGPGTPHRQPGLDTLLRTFEKLDINDVVDPSKKAEWGLEPAAYTCTLSVAGSDEQVVLEGGRPDPAGNGYLRLAKSEVDRVYEVPGATFEKVFGLGRSLNLFELPGLTVAPEALAKIDIVQPEGNVTLVKEGTEWAIEQPQAGLSPQPNAISTLTSLVTRWTPADYAMRSDDVFANAPARSVALTLTDGTSHSLTLGQDATSLDGAYVRLDGGPTVLVMSRADIDKIFVAPSGLYQLSLFDLAEDEVQVVTLARGTDSLTLSREGEAWNLTTGDTTTPAASDAMDMFLPALVDLQADAILFGQTALTEAPEATLSFTTSDGTVRTIQFGPVTDNLRNLCLVEQGLVVSVDSLVAADLLVNADSLKQPVPEEAPIETPAPETPVAAPETPAAEPVAPVTEPVAPVITEAPVPDTTAVTPDAPAAEPAAPVATEAPVAEPAAPADQADVPAEPAPATPIAETPAPDATAASPETVGDPTGGT